MLILAIVLLTVGVLIYVFGLTLYILAMRNKYYGKTTEAEVVSVRPIGFGPFHVHLISLEYSLHNAHYYKEVPALFVRGSVEVGRKLSIGASDKQDKVVLRESLSRVPFWILGLICIALGVCILLGVF